jgi:hypothetical protein
MSVVHISNLYIGNLRMIWKLYAALKILRIRKTMTPNAKGKPRMRHPGANLTVLLGAACLAAYAAVAAHVQRASISVLRGAQVF